ncbi:hypothetical protein OSB04_001365 [Centaurea solstitialis]|uniref:Uncharacterized protein n=1 Tax=Centaurea solstitialis TaxID=347529 RepID=A0AA38WUE1_9ASTR|nr:hypothetical protein OSB04_001365 [Centaurea solstitialis]
MPVLLIQFYSDFFPPFSSRQKTEPQKRKRDEKHSSYKPRKFPPVDRKKDVKHSGKRKNTNFKNRNSGGKRQKQSGHT